MNRIRQRQRSLNSTNNALIIAENWLPIKVESVKLLPGRFRCPAFQADTKIAMEEIFDVDAAAPGVIGLKITVIFPVSSRDYVGSPQTHVPFRVSIPLGARWSLDLLHFLPRISFSSAIRGGYYRCEGTNRNGKLLHVSPIGSPLYNQKQDRLIVNNVCVAAADVPKRRSIYAFNSAPLLASVMTNFSW